MSLRDLAEMFLERGFAFTHEAVREWESRFAPLIADQLPVKRPGQTAGSWPIAANGSVELHGGKAENGSVDGPVKCWPQRDGF